MSGKEDAFTFIGSNAFTGTAGQLHAINTGAVDDNGRAIYLVEGDTNGDRVADFQISLHVDGILGAADFVF
jgi:serralysin